MVQIDSKPQEEVFGSVFLAHIDKSHLLVGERLATRHGSLYLVPKRLKPLVVVEPAHHYHAITFHELHEIVAQHRKVARLRNGVYQHKRLLMQLAASTRVAVKRHLQRVVALYAVEIGCQHIAHHWIAAQRRLIEVELTRRRHVEHGCRRQPIASAHLQDVLRIEEISDAEQHLQVLERGNPAMGPVLAHDLYHRLAQLVDVVIAIIGRLLAQHKTHKVESKGRMDAMPFAAMMTD